MIDNLLFLLKEYMRTEADNGEDLYDSVHPMLITFDDNDKAVDMFQIGVHRSIYDDMIALVNINEFAEAEKCCLICPAKSRPISGDPSEVKKVILLAACPSPSELIVTLFDYQNDELIEEGSNSDNGGIMTHAMRMVALRLAVNKAKRALGDKAGPLEESLSKITLSFANLVEAYDKG